MDSRNIVLIGFMGTGKSTVGKLLAARLKREHVDIDQYIEKKERRKIHDIFEKEGEGAFRAMEKEAIRTLAAGENKVITPGGGAGLDSDNLAVLKQNGRVFLLEASPELIYERVKRSKHRPLLKKDNSLEEIRRLLAERQGPYSKADVRIATDGKRKSQVAEEIIRAMRREIS